jgi:AcrR family transcriptional regulator
MNRTTVPSTRPPKPAGKPAARRGRPTGDRDAKRTGLLRAAVSVIAEDGYSAASLRKVAEQAGCTTGAVTYYFANKEEMLIAVAQLLFDEFDALLEHSEDRIDVKAMLVRWIDRTKANDSELWLVLFQLLSHARHDPAVVAVVQHRYARFRKVLTAILTRGQSQGMIRTDISAELLADQLSAISDGWLMMFPIEPERFSPKRVQALLDAAVKMIAPPAAADGKSGGRRK